MKKLIALIFVLALFLTSCGAIKDKTNTNSQNQSVNTDVVGSVEDENKTQPEGTQPEEKLPDDDLPEDNDHEDKDHEVPPEHNTHDYVAIVTAPTCDSEGYITYTCSVCSDSYVADNVSALGHSYNSVVTDPTCENDGYTTFTCTICKDSYIGNEVEAVGHSYKSATTAPTCIATGYTTYTCSACGDSYVSDVSSALGHKYDAVVTEPTDDKNGYITYTCVVCGDYYVVEDASHAHNYSVSVTAPTCDKTGYTTYTCSTCGDSYVANEVSALGHSYKSVVTAPTCTEAGYTTYTCTICSNSYTGNEVAATGHNYKSSVTAPTCTVAGYTTYTCSACSDSYIGNTVEATGHSYKSTVTAPTCTVDGFTTYSCSACSDSYVDNTVKATGHSYKSTVTAPTCTVDGFTTYSCSACSDSYVDNTVKATGHSYKSTVTAPTCTVDGFTTYSCSACSDSYVDNTVKATGHSYKSTVTAPTCTAAGYTTYTCSTCSDSYTGNSVAATGHTQKTVKGYSATCTVSGLSDGVVCSVCNVTITAQTAIAPLGHSWVDATTSAPKTCSTCGLTEGDKLPDDSTGSGSSSGAYNDTLYVNYINVGQGDSIFIKVGDCDILIDAGTSSYGSTVSNYLSNQGVDDIELLINTHPDSDHCGGLTKVLNNFVVEEVWISKDTSKDTAAYNNFISAVSSEGLTAKKPSAGYVFTYEYLTMTVLYSSVGSDANNSSIVIMLEYGSFKFLFTGDAGEEVEKKLLSSGANLSCDVLKVGHHGSKYSSTSSFLSATGADYGVICVGSNSYGHPTSDALSRLSSAGISVYRTDLNGNVVFSTNGATLTLPGGSTVGGGSGSGTSGGTSSGGTSSGGTSSGTEYFIGNTETKVFHLPTCSNLPAASKQNVMYNYSWIVNIAGYTPCGKCLKNYSGGTSYIANTETKVYHLTTCSYLPASSKQKVIYDTTGYTPCGHCLKGSTTQFYIANTETKVYHLPSCSYLPASSKQAVIYDTSGYTPCGHCMKN